MGTFPFLDTNILLRHLLADHLLRLCFSALRWSIEEILDDFPSLREEHVRAVIAFAAASAEEDMPLPETPAPV
jgi:hypothetical protein